MVESLHCSPEITTILLIGYSESEVKSLSRVRLFETLRTVAYQAPLSVGFLRQEYWSGLPFPSPGDLPYPEIKPRFPALQADSLPSEQSGKPRTRKKPYKNYTEMSFKTLSQIISCTSWGWQCSQCVSLWKTHLEGSNCFCFLVCFFCLFFTQLQIRGIILSPSCPS